MNDRRVLVTGGSGFIGTNVVERLVERGQIVRNIDIAAPRDRDQLDRWSRVDILDRQQLLAEMAAFEPHLVVHLAARTDLDERRNLGGYAANIEGAMNVVEAVRATASVARVIFASSQLVSAIASGSGDRDYQPMTLYGDSKVLTERIVHLANDMGATWTIVRPTSIWGPWFGVPFLPFFLAIRRGLYIHPAGNEIRKHWGYVGNTVFQLERLLEAPVEDVNRRTFYLADYDQVDLRAFAESVRGALGAPPIRVASARLLRPLASVGDLAVRLGWRDPPLTSFRYANLVRSEAQDVGPIRQFAPELPYSVEEGINLTVRWMRERGLVR